MFPPQTLIRSFSSSRLFKSIIKPYNFSRNQRCDCFSTLPDFSLPLPADSGAGDSSSHASSNSSRVEALVVRVLEDAVYGVIVSRSTPDWLPLVPGGSYWVPPKRRDYGVAQLLRSLNNTHLPDIDNLIFFQRPRPLSDYYVGRNNDSSSDDSDETEAKDQSDDLEC